MSAEPEYRFSEGCGHPSNIPGLRLGSGFDETLTLSLPVEIFVLLLFDYLIGVEEEVVQEAPPISLVS